MKKNVAGQYLSVGLVLAADGSAATGLTPTVRRNLDGTDAAITGTVTEPNSDGKYLIALSQADTNGDCCSYYITAATAVPVCINVHTDYPQTGDSYAVVANATYGLDKIKSDTAAILVDTGTDGVKIAATQGAVTWGQQKIEASAIGQGALHIVNSGISGVGMYAEGQNKGMHGKASAASGNGIAGEGGSSGTGLIGSGAYGIAAVGTTADIYGDITGNLSGSVGSVTDASAIADAVWDEALAGHVVAGSSGATLTLAGAASGTGSITFTYTLTDSGDGTAIEGATVEVYSDSTMSTLVAAGTTNTAGAVVFYLDAGTYYLRRIKAGYSFTNPDTETVA